MSDPRRGQPGTPIRGQTARRFTARARYGKWAQHASPKSFYTLLMICRGGGHMLGAGSNMRVARPQAEDFAVIIGGTVSTRGFYIEPVYAFRYLVLFNRLRGIGVRVTPRPYMGFLGFFFCRQFVVRRRRPALLHKVANSVAVLLDVRPGISWRAYQSFPPCCGASLKFFSFAARGRCSFQITQAPMIVQ